MTAPPPEPRVHINRPSSTRYVARVRARGCRRYVLVGRPVRDRATAIRRMARAFAAGRWQRGDVLVVADWYDPLVVCELVRR